MRCVFSDDVFTIYGLFTQEGHILVGQIGYRYSVVEAAREKPTRFLR